MKPRLLLGLFALVALLQWALPLGLIVQHERTLSEGTVYRFRTAPVDPVDPFRGRYVALQFPAATYAVPPDWERPRGLAYAPVLRGADGEAVLGAPQATPPAAGDYLPVRLRWVEEGRVQVQLPFDRYYLDERLAPEAERLYREAAAARTGDAAPGALSAHVQVRIRKGHGVLEDLLIDGQPLRERLRATAAP
jgi:uncharacterized membrane-anchored protein